MLGLLVGTIFYPVISETKRHKVRTNYCPSRAFLHALLQFVMWAFRLAAIPLAIVLFVVLTRYASYLYSGVVEAEPSQELLHVGSICFMPRLPVSVLLAYGREQPLQGVSPTRILNLNR